MEVYLFQNGVRAVRKKDFIQHGAVVEISHGDNKDQLKVSELQIYSYIL